MIGNAFTLDTNILIYSMDGTSGIKHALAREIMNRVVGGRCRLTLQAVSEFYSATTRKRRLAQSEASETAGELLLLFPTIPASATAIRSALALSVAGRASYWDALLVATAAEGGCTAIITEDLRAGGTLGGVRIVNPFAGDRLSPDCEALLAQ